MADPTFSQAPQKSWFSQLVGGVGNALNSVVQPWNTPVNLPAGLTYTPGDQTLTKTPSANLPQGQTGGATAPAFSPAPNQTPGTSLAAQQQAQQAQQQSLVQAQLDRLGNQQNIGQQNILGQYNQALGQLTNQQSIAQRNYDTAVHQAQQDNQTAKTNIDSGVRNQVTGLQRLLGSRGAGNSSAALTLAPYAAGREGSIQRGQVQDAYGRNMNALDTSYGDTQTQFTDARGNLDAQKQNQQNNLLQQLAQIRQNLLGQMPNPDVNQINGLGSQIDNLGKQVTYIPQAVNFKTPDLSKYNYAQPGITANNGTSAADQYVTPYSYLLNGDQRKNLVGQSGVFA